MSDNRAWWTVAPVKAVSEQIVQQFESNRLLQLLKSLRTAQLARLIPRC